MREDSIKKPQRVTPSPDPGQKDAFLRMYRQRTGSGNTGIMTMIRQQFTCISLPVWIISLTALLIALCGAGTNRDVVFAVAFFMPFVSGIAVFDTFRSRMYDMSEIESVTLFSLRGVFFAKIVCIGAIHLALLFLLPLIVTPTCQYNYFTTGIMITTPYLISSIASFKAEKSPFGRRNPLVCLGISVLTSGLVLIVNEKNIDLTEVQPELLNILFIALAALLLIEVRKTLKWEEYLWN